MFRPLAQLGSTILATLVIVGVSTAATVPMRQRATGTLTDIVPGHLTYSGQGQASLLGGYTVVGSADFDNLGNVLNGHDTVTTADGATIAADFAGTYTPQIDGSIRFDLVVAWGSGTGRLTGVTGQSTLVAYLDTLAPGAAFRYTSIGNLDFP